MSESLAVLFRLGKALRSADSAEFCEQYDDRLLKQTGLSYITLINQKECVRQISELDDEDFSLLQSALVAGGDDSTTPLRLELDGDHLAGSVADQLECLLERLRTEKRGRVSEDSGTISDMDSGCGTTVEEECVRSETSGERDSVYTAVNGSSRANSQQTRFKHSSNTVPSSDLERERERDVCDGAVWSRTHNQQRQRRKGARETQRGQIADNPHRQDHPKYHGSTTHTRHTDQRFRPRAEVIEHTTHRKQKSHDPATLNTKPAPLNSSEEVPSEIREVEDDSSPTEGGPFITHWGKGRWRKNTNTRGRRQYSNAHQFYPHPRPKFSQQGVNSNTGTRYPQSRGGRSVGYNSRQERDTNFYRGSERGKEGYRDGGTWLDHTVQQRGGDTPHNSPREPPNRSLDRERSPRQQKVESSTDSSSKEGTVVTSETVAAVKTQISVELPAKLQSEKPLKRLSYASVTGSSGSGKSTGAKATQSPTSAENNHEEQKAAKNGHCKPVVATTSTTTVQDHVSGATPTVHANETTTTTSANINHELAAKNNHCKEVVATTSTTSGPNHGSTVSTTVHVHKTTTTTSANINHKERTVAKSGHCKQVVATTSTTTGPDSSGTTNSTTTTIAHTNQTTTTTIHTNRDNSGSNPANYSATTTAHSATKKGPTSSTVTTTGPKHATPDQTRPTGDHASSTNEAIAASFNYSEAVDFLWRGWQEVQLEQSGPTEVQRSVNQSRQSSRKPTRSPIH